MSVWLNYLAARMGLYRELGVMRLDDNGVWIDEPLENYPRVSAQREPLPPEVPEAWLAMNEIPAGTAPAAPVKMEPKALFRKENEASHED